MHLYDFELEFIWLERVDDAHRKGTVENHESELQPSEPLRNETLPAGDFNALIHEFDRRRRGRFGILLGGQSPWAALQAWEDWAFHLMLSSGKQIELCELALESASSLFRALMAGEAQDGNAWTKFRGSALP